ncbi:MAG: DUF1542 domain-containing protein [Tissierellia bacterium]|nr:DUF1542 domain-containing protein [Tissierellia bacterium]
MLDSKKRISLMLSLLLLFMSFCGPWTEVVYATGDTVEVSNWPEFVAAYNNIEVSNIILKADITQGEGGTGKLSARIPSLTISGLNEGKREGGNVKLDLKSTRLEFGSPATSEETIKLEDIIIANSTSNSFANIPSNSKMTFHLKNVKSEVSTNGVHMLRLSQGHTSIHIFEGEIDITTRAEFAEPGSVLIKSGADFKGHQINASGSLPYSAFYYISGSLNNNERYFRVEDNAKVSMTRDLVSNYPPIYYQYGVIEVGNNVEWTQNNYKHFVSDMLSKSIPKRIIFGKRNTIVATNSSQDSIDLSGSENYVEFGPGSSLKIQGGGNVVSVANGSKVVFRNPVGLDLETTGGGYNRVFNLNASGEVEFQYVTLGTWIPTADVAGEPTAKFEKVKNVAFKGSTRDKVNATSDNADLVTHFTANNSKRILTDKIEVGGVAVQYIDQSGNTVGEPIAIDFDKTSYVVDEALDIPAELRTNPSIPEGYHYATEIELNGKTQPEYAYTGMEGVEDPRITNIYIQGDPTEITIKYLNTRNTDQVVYESKVNKVAGDVINLNSEEYKAIIKAPYLYSVGEDLLEGQVQLGEVSVTPNGEYIIYVNEPQELYDGKQAAKKEIDDAAKIQKDKIDSLTNLSEEKKIELKGKVDEQANLAKDAIDKAIDIESVTIAKDKGLLEIAREGALAEIVDKYNEKISAIEAVEGAKPEDIATAKDQAFYAMDGAIESIKKSESIEEILDLKEMGKGYIDSVELPKSGLENSKDDAKAAIDEKAKAEKDKIDSLTNLSGEEKTELKGKVDDQANLAKDNVDKAKDIDEFNTSKEAGLIAIDKEGAIAELIAKANEKNAEIDAVDGAKPEDTLLSKNAVQNELSLAIQEVINSQSFEEVNKSKENGKEAIDNVALPKNGLENAKDDAKKEIDDAAAAQKEKIDGMTDFTEEERQKAKDEVDRLAEEGKDAVDLAESKEVVNTVKDGVIAEIIEVVPEISPERELEEYKEAAKKEIDDAATSQKEKIDGMIEFTEEERQKAKDEVDKLAEEGKGAVDSAESKDAVDVAKDNAITEIGKVEPEINSERELQESKDNAKAEVDKAAEDKKNAIENDASLSDKAKEDAIAKVEEEREKGNENIDNSTTIEEVESSKDTAIEEINKVTPKTPEEELQDAKDKAKAEIEQAWKEKVEEIGALDDVSSEDKANAIEEINNHKDLGMNAVDNSTTIDEILTEKEEAIENINGVKPETNSEKLKKEKEEAISELEQAAEDKINEINRVPGATDEDKAAAIEEVNREKEEAIKNIENGTTVEEINDSKEDGKTAIENVELPEGDVDKAKEDAKDAIEQAAEDKINEINRTPGASDEDKQTAIEEVNREKEEAIENIENGASIDEINDAKKDGLDSINRIPLPNGYEPEEEREDDFDHSGLDSIIWDWGHNKEEVVVEPVVEYFVLKSYLNGYPDGTVRPNGEITRGEVAAILARLKLNQSDIEYNPETLYKDVLSNHWNAKYISFVTDNGIMNGYGNNEFRPNEKITRAEYAVALARFSNLIESQSSFADVQGHWAEKLIGAVANKGWIAGYEDGSFNPNANITRAEVAAMTNKMLGREFDYSMLANTELKQFSDLVTNVWSYNDMILATNTFEIEK